MKGLKIAFDGPAASGKSTIAKELARRLSYIYIDTGAMYRAVTWQSLMLSASFEREQDIADIAHRYPVELRPDPSCPQGYRVIIDGKDITDHITDAEVNRHVSIVARISDVRRTLVAHQKAMASHGGVVMAGRDITTVVLPDADIKIYLTASEEERIRRRHLELIEKGEAAEVTSVTENIKLRDTIDSSREDSPLAIADDAMVLDSTGKSIEDVLQEVMKIVEGCRVS
jgi:CMP/dCMP kinase